MRNVVIATETRDYDDHTQLAAIQQRAAADLARFRPEDIPHPADIIREGREERDKRTVVAQPFTDQIRLIK